MRNIKILNSVRGCFIRTQTDLSRSTAREQGVAELAQYKANFELGLFPNQTLQ